MPNKITSEELLNFSGQTLANELENIMQQDKNVLYVEHNLDSNSLNIFKDQLMLNEILADL